MAKKTSRLAALCCALVVAAGLLFGAREAFAKSPAFDCLNDGYNYLGACISPSSCQTRCEAVGGPESIGDCWGVGDACCRCFH